MIELKENGERPVNENDRIKAMIKLEELIGQVNRESLSNEDKEHYDTVKKLYDDMRLI